MLTGLTIFSLTPLGLQLITVFSLIKSGLKPTVGWACKRSSYQACFKSTGKIISSVIREKGKSQNRYFKKTKHSKFSKNQHFLLPDTHMYVCVSGGKKCSFLEHLVWFVFMKHPFRDSSFWLIADDLFYLV